MKMEGREMLVDIAAFDEYTGNMEDSEETVKLKTLFLESAEELVSEYLRFKPEDEWKEDIPEIVKLTILRIATLMLMEGGENIGISGKSFSDNSRSFISYTNYHKYLSPLQTLRKVVF